MSNKETSTPSAVCHLYGGPQDGAEHTFEVLPIALVDPCGGGYYQLNTEVLRDGAHVFEYRPPTRALRPPPACRSRGILKPPRAVARGSEPGSSPDGESAGFRVFWPRLRGIRLVCCQTLPAPAG